MGQLMLLGEVLERGAQRYPGARRDLLHRGAHVALVLQGDRGIDDVLARDLGALAPAIDIGGEIGLG